MRKIAIVTTLLVVAALAQDAVETAFKTRDKDGDGKLTPAELAAPRLFAQMDADGDRSVTLEEARAYYGQARGDRRPQPAHHRDIPYAEIDGVDAKLLSLDLYAPKKNGKHPVMVMIHGGGWRNGDKRASAMTRHKVPHFVGSGFAYVSINYRLSKTPGIKHPAHVKDVARALAWELATAPQASLRNGPRAVELASQAYQAYPNHPEMADVWAAALAEAGRFTEASRVTRRAVKRALTRGQPALARRIRSRAELYGQLQPFRQAR